MYREPNEDIMAAYGKEIGNSLGMKRNRKCLWKTNYGLKTDLGLARMIVHFSGKIIKEEKL